MRILPKQHVSQNSKSDSNSFEDYAEEEKNAMSLNPDYAWQKIRESQVFLEPPVKQIPRRDANTDASSNESSEKDDFVRFVFISDTHGSHRDITHLPKGDVLVHAGDFTKSGETGAIEDLDRFFHELMGRTSDTHTVATKDPTFSKVICVAGNHDLTLHSDYYNREWKRFHDRKFDSDSAENSIRKHAIYLHDEPYELEFPSDNSVQIWGSPYSSPKFWDCAFNEDRGSPIREHWDKIPSRDNCDTAKQPVDVLITHGPPLGRGDLVILPGHRRPGRRANTTRAGCYDLLQVIQERIRPKINVFGHIHEDYGVTYDGTTLYVNASTMNQQHEVVHLPIVVDVPRENSSCAKVVKPSSLFRNANITSLEKWIEWCHQNGHSNVATVIEQDFPPSKAVEWFGAEGEATQEPSPDRFLEATANILDHSYERSHERLIREFRRDLASMVFHLYALSMEE